MSGTRVAITVVQHRSFAIYLGATLVTLILLSASGFGDWGVAHGQTAPGHHAGTRTAESTPGPPGPAGATDSDQLVVSRAAPSSSITTAVGLSLIAVGIALMLTGAVRAYRRRRSGPSVSAIDRAPATADVTGDE